MISEFACLPCLPAGRRQAGISDFKSAIRNQNMINIMLNKRPLLGNSNFKICNFVSELQLLQFAD
jgi:hypothetical protein